MSVSRRQALFCASAITAAGGLAAAPAWTAAAAASEGGPSHTVDVMAHGARADGKSDDTAAVEAAIAAAEAAPASGGAPPANGNTVYFPPGRYVVSRPIVVPGYVKLKGFGTRVSAIAAAPRFGHDFLIKLEEDRIAFDTVLEDLRIECMGRTSGVYSNRANEHSGLRNVLVADFTRYGVMLEHAGRQQAQNYRLEDLELIGANQSIAVTGLSQSGGTARVTTQEAHGWSAGDAFGLIGAKEPEYLGAFKVTAVPSARSFTFAVDPTAPPRATGSIKVSRQVHVRIVGGNATVRGLDHITMVTRKGAQGAGIGIMADGCGGLFSRIHAERMAVAIVVGMNQKCRALSIVGTYMGPKLAVAAQLDDAQESTHLSLMAHRRTGDVPILIWDKANGIRSREVAASLYATGAGEPGFDQAVVTTLADAGPNRVVNDLDLNNGAVLKVDGRQVISERQPALGRLKDRTKGRAGSALERVSGSGDARRINDNFASLNAKLDLLIDRLGKSRGHGLTAD